MFFTKFARAIAFLGLAIGLFRAAIAFAVIWGYLPDQARSRYLGSGTTGEILDRAWEIVFVCVVVGMLSEISIGIRRMRE